MPSNKLGTLETFECAPHLCALEFRARSSLESFVVCHDAWARSRARKDTHAYDRPCNYTGHSLPTLMVFIRRHAAITLEPAKHAQSNNASKVGAPIGLSEWRNMSICIWLQCRASREFDISLPTRVRAVGGGVHYVRYAGHELWFRSAKWTAKWVTVV